MEQIIKTYKGKTVLVTGHTGFKGSWLSIWLNLLGARVIGYSLDPYTENDNFVVSNIKDKIIDIRGDIRDFDKLSNVFSKYNPEIVFHLAAQPLVRLSYEMPKETYEINVMGTINVLECIRKTANSKIGIMVTTDKCYENKEQIWSYRENDAMGGYDPYSSSKGCCELIIASYRNSFMNPKKFNLHGKSIASVRAGNVIGGGDWSKDRIVPDTIRALINNEIIEIRNPNSIRPWQHVLEPLNGYLLLGKKMNEDGAKYCEGWNFGDNQERMFYVKDIVGMIIEKWGKGSWLEKSSEESLHESSILTLDCTKAKKYLEWKSKLTLEECIEFTIEWYKEYMKSENVYDICVKQIKDYMNKN